MSIHRTQSGKWKVRWLPPGGKERSRTFERKREADEFQAAVHASRTAERVHLVDEPLWRRRLRAQLGDEAEICADAFNPHGSFVYLLWGLAEDRPIYVGLSTNVLARLGGHLSDEAKRNRVTRITLIRCSSTDSARHLELKLIHFYRPELNVADNGECVDCGTMVAGTALRCTTCRAATNGPSVGPPAAQISPPSATPALSDELAKIRSAHQRALARLAPT